MDLYSLNVVDVDHDLGSGFFWVEFENGKTLQCCLVSKQDSVDDFLYFVKALELGNTGYSEGLSADCNEWAVNNGEWSHIEEFLIDKARLVGLQIVS